MGRKPSRGVESAPVIAAQFKRIAKGVDLYQKNLQNQSPIAPTLIQDSNKIKQACRNYDAAIKIAETDLEKFKKEILKEANDAHGNVNLSLEVLRNLRQPFDIELLLIALGRSDFSAVQNGNPSLSPDQIKALMEKVGTYALMLTDYQKLVRCRGKLVDYRILLEGSAEKSELQQAALEYRQNRDAERAFANASQYPHFLAFEALANLLIRKDQLEALESLTDLNDGWKLFEARTGFGKSKVLMPLWLILMTKKSQLSFVVTPSTLFDQEDNYLQNLLQRSYHFFAERIDFSRDSDCSEADILTIEQTLRRAQETRRPVFMSDQTAHQLLVLKIKELAAQENSADNYAALEALLHVRNYIKRKGVLFIDEPHKVLDDSQESNYSLGQAMSFEDWRLLFNLDLYKTFFTLMKGKYRVEFSDEEKDFPLLTEELYRAEILPAILENLIKAKKIHIDSDDALHYLQGGMNQEEQEAFEKTLSGSKNEDFNASKMRVLHDQLHHYLPQTLKKNANEHYALVDDMNDRSAIPMEDARNPKKGNEYCSPDQILNFTIQANLKMPFPLKYVSSYLEKLSSQAASEMREGVENITGTVAYKKFSLIINGMKTPPKRLLKLLPEECEAIQAHINNNFIARLQFIGFAVLPTILRYNEKITSTPHLVMQCFKNGFGASGSLSMQNYPSKFKIDADEEAMAKTLITLLQKSDKAQLSAVIELPATDSQSVLEVLPKVAEKASVLIEIGAVLRNYPTLLDEAKAVLKQFPHFDGVATFDENGQPIVLKRGEKRFIPKDLITVEPNKLFWIYGQKDITGTDQKLPPLAEAIVFVNEHTTLTELVQGVGRLRGIHAGQNARFCLDSDSALKIKQFLGKAKADKLHYLDIVEYCSKKEGKNNGDVDFQSLPLQWNALLELPFWEQSCKMIGGGAGVARDFHLLRSLLVEQTKDDPLLRASLSKDPLGIEKALAKLTKRYHEKIVKIKAELATSATGLGEKFEEASLKAGMKKIQDNMQYSNEVYFNDDANATQTTIAAADQVNNAQADQQMFLNMQAENTGVQDSQNTTEAESTQELSTWASKISKRRWMPHRNEIDLHPIKRLFSHPKLKMFASLFSDVELFISENSVITLEGDSLDAPGWVNGYLKPLHYIFISPKGQQGIIDEDEATIKIINQDQGTLWLVNHGVVYSTQELTREKLIKNQAFVKLELVVKLLDGDFAFDDLQWSILTNWLDANQRKLWLNFIDSVLCEVRPNLNKTGLYYKIKAFLDS
jgi:Protein of unknown function (DUF3638)/Type III restriction enzyme, res subunit